MYTILLVIHTIIVIFLIGLVLIQRTSADGMGGLGGGGGNQFLTGRSTANLLTRTTAILAGLFMLTSITLAVMANHMTSGSILDTTKIEDVKAPVPAAPVDAKKDEAVKKEYPQTIPAPAAPVKPATPAVPKPE